MAGEPAAVLRARVREQPAVAVAAHVRETRHRAIGDHDVIVCGATDRDAIWERRAGLLRERIDLVVFLRHPIAAMRQGFLDFFVDRQRRAALDSSQAER